MDAKPDTSALRVKQPITGKEDTTINNSHESAAQLTCKRPAAFAARRVQKSSHPPATAALAGAARRTAPPKKVKSKVAVELADCLSKLGL